MIQRQYETCSRRRANWVRERNYLLKRHPVLVPVLLLLGAGLASSASFSAGNVFPLLTLLGIPSNVLCLSVALVLGITGILTSIIGILEYIDRRTIQAAMFPEAKE
jgi:VIT1/CCC1 family predicted Fe2+/Mn2+ transporter